MMSLSRKRPEQSKYTLAFAVLYSFFLHAAVVFAALFLHFLLIPKAFLPPVYQVKLVGQPKETVPGPAPVAAPAPVPPQKEAISDQVKPSPKTEKPVMKLKKAEPEKGSMPDLAGQKKTPAPLEQAKPIETATQKAPAAPSASAEGPATTGKKGEVVDVTPRQDFKYPWYIDNVANQIKQNWNPPPGSINMKARVIFKINRSGWVAADVRLDDEHSNGSFQFKQAAYRAIHASNPFPPLPEEFYQLSLEFAVDLIAENN